MWAVDDVTVTSKLFRTAGNEAITFHLGHAQEFCGKFPVLALVFSSNSLVRKYEQTYKSLL